MTEIWQLNGETTVIHIYSDGSAWQWWSSDGCANHMNESQLRQARTWLQQAGWSLVVVPSL